MRQKTIQIRGFDVGTISRALAETLPACVGDEAPIVELRINGRIVIHGRIRAAEFGDGGIDFEFPGDRPPPLPMPLPPDPVGGDA